MSRPHVIVVGGGFGGLAAAKALARAPVRVTLLDRQNHHLFQPLLYQVAMAGLSPADIASPIRSVLAHQKNVSVLLDEVLDVDLDGKTLETRNGGTLAFDYLVLATGAKTDYFGHGDWEQAAPGLKSLSDAVEIRRRVLLAFEVAEREQDPELRQVLNTFVVIGGGPTGVELAGAVRELSQWVLAKDFRSIDPRKTRVILLEGGSRVLPAFDPSLSARAVEQLGELGVEIRTGAKVTTIDDQGVCIGDERIRAATVLWAAGVRTTRLTAALARHGATLDRGGRVEVEKDCSIPGHPAVFAIGDMTRFVGEDGQPLPGLSPVAMQQGRFVARVIGARSSGLQGPGVFRYVDKGSMATIGRSRAIAQVGPIRLSGFLAWLAWLFVHLWFLIGHRNRVAVLLTWAWSYFTYARGARLITGRQDPPRAILGA